MGVDVLLTTLHARLGLEEASGGRTLVLTVLRNVGREDPKFRRLKASNDKLWRGLLQHPELCMVIEAAGFQRSSPDQERSLDISQLQLELDRLLVDSADVG